MDLILPQKKIVMESQQPFKPPRQNVSKVLREKFENKILVDSSTSSTEDMSETRMDADIEYCLREEAQNWLATHGHKLFSLEASKHLAAEAKRKNLRGNR